MIGYTLNVETQVCGTLNGSYSVVVVDEDDDHILFKFHENLGFIDGTLILRREGFVPSG